MSKFTILVIGSALASFLVSGGYTLLPRAVYDPACDIKGNISFTSGERIYHVRGQRDYSSTTIRARHGERWFCSEEEALDAGWRRSTH